MDDPGLSALKSSACVVAEVSLLREAMKTLCDRVATHAIRLRDALKPEGGSRVKLSIDVIEAEVAIARRALTGSIEVMDAGPNRE